MQEKAISVTDLTLHLKAVVEELFPTLWVAGEITDLVHARSGHLYFTLKDDTAQIRGVMWRSSAQKMKFELEDGQAVLCQGNLEVYAPRGTYQLVVRRVEPQGVGALQLAFLKLQAKLEAEGLFAAERKKELPRFPRRIGIVTSPSGAAVRDFLEAASNRWRGAEILVIPAQVQGKGAAKTIVAGIKAAHQIKPALDVLVVSRGGGSLEDLWCFNEEEVVRAIAKSRLPTVSAVGHEIDVTLCDLAADVRALTPTDAATRVLPDGQMLFQAHQNLSSRLHQSIRGLIHRRQQQLDSLSLRPILSKPHAFIQLRSRELDDLDARARRAIWARVQLNRAKLSTVAASLSALSPLNVLTRGYSVTSDANGQTIDRADQVSVGDKLHTQVHNGRIESTVDRVSPE
ncbi:MAG: exodeoxyribonuclease VII large subunit [Pirellulaceae bacterium]|nr:exodeoxyribonuclease VII large subunit [Pirellulaceae bacterium]